MSNPTSAAESSRTSIEIECEICMLPFDTERHCPRILTKCGHTICEDCVKKLWEKGRMQGVKCPFDRVFTSVKGGITKLPKNYIVEQILESQGTILKTDIPTGRCSINSSHEAWFTCAECSADFCECCFDIEHADLDLGIHKKTPSIDKLYEAPKCMSHPMNFADFFCQDSTCKAENKVICKTCLLHKHENHKHGRLEQIVAENQKKLKKELIKEAVLDETQPYLADYIPWLNETHEKNHSEYKTQVEHIKEFYNRQMTEAVKKFEDYAEKKRVQASKMYEEYKEATAQKETLKSIRSEIRSRLMRKRKLEDVEDLVKRHKKTHEELNQRRKITPMFSPLSMVCFKFPRVAELGIIDPDDPSTPSDLDN